MFLNQFLRNQQQSPYGAAGSPLATALLMPQLGGARTAGNYATQGAPIAQPAGTIAGTAGQPAAATAATAPAAPQGLQALLALAKGQTANYPTPQQAVTTANQQGAAGQTGMSDHGMGGAGIGNTPSPGIGPQGQVAAAPQSFWGSPMGQGMSSMGGDLSSFYNWLKNRGGPQSQPWTSYNPNNVMDQGGNAMMQGGMQQAADAGGGSWLSSLFGGGASADGNFGGGSGGFMGFGGYGG